MTAAALLAGLAPWLFVLWLAQRLRAYCEQRQLPAREVLGVTTALGWCLVACVAAGGGVVLNVGVSAALESVWAGVTAGSGGVALQALLEETGKGVVLVGLLALGRLRTPVGGLLLGMAAGAGFAGLETFLSLQVIAAQTPEVHRWLSALAFRLLFGAVLHMAATAWLGWWLGLHLRGGAPLWRALGVGLGGGWALHAAWNLGVVAASGPGVGWLPILALISLAASSVIVMLFGLRLGLRMALATAPDPIAPRSRTSPPR